MGLPVQALAVSQNAPDRPPADDVLTVLQVRRNAIRGFAAGFLFAALVFVAFVAPGARYSPMYYLALAFVVAMTGGAVITLVLVALTARTVVRNVD